jgi:hypothetical protein
MTRLVAAAVCTALAFVAGSLLAGDREPPSSAPIAPISRAATPQLRVPRPVATPELPASEPAPSVAADASSGSAPTSGGGATGGGGTPSSGGGGSSGGGSGGGGGSGAAPVIVGVD